MRAALVVSLLCALFGESARAAPQPLSCNGSPALCDRSYGNITFFGAHNSFAVNHNKINPIAALAACQTLSVTDQLDRGIRFLQGQAHWYDGKMRLCHTSCALLDGGEMVTYLKRVKGWMDQHPNEVVTLLLTNEDRKDVKQFWQPVYAASGIEQYAYNPPVKSIHRDQWPSLRTIIASGKRLIVFMDYGEDTNEVPYILSEFDNMWEPPFDSINKNFPCSVSRVNGSPDGKMYMLNHNLNKAINLGKNQITYSDVKDAPTTNGVNSILQDANGCAHLAGGRWPNFVMMDHVEKGNWFDLYKGMNHLT